MCVIPLRKSAGADGPAVGEVELSAVDLLAWAKWSASTRRFIETQGDSFPIRPIALRHGELMVRLHNWLHNELAKANAADLADANALQEERNAVLAGIDDPVAARRLTEAITKQRESPKPIRAEDLPDILRSSG
jgi:hypothetical protein